MPVVTLNTSKSLSDSQMTKIAEDLSVITESILRKNKNVIVIRFKYDDQSGIWHSNGRVPMDSLIFELSILVTKGTNTEPEKADWISAAWRVITGALGPSEHPNYISVQELDGSNWGYNGVTQNSRKKASA